MATEDEIEARRAERKAALEAQKAEQRAADLEALDAAEIELGDHAVMRVNLPAYAPELPTMLVLRLPKPSEMKRFQSAVSRDERAKARLEASEMLVRACLVYPEPAVYERVCETFTGVAPSTALVLMEACQAKRAEEGKG